MRQPKWVVLLKKRVKKLEDKFEKRTETEYMKYLEEKLHLAGEKYAWGDLQTRVSGIERQFKPMYFLPQQAYVKEVARTTIEQAKSEITPDLEREIVAEIKRRAKSQTGGFAVKSRRKKKAKG